MDLDELRSVQTRERATDGLQELRDSFYTDVAAYIQGLRERRETAAAEATDPFRNPTVNELTDEIETAEQVAEAIYERRIGKLVKQASLAAAGMPDDASGLTDEEQALYDDIVERIRENKTDVLDVIAGAKPIERKPTDGDRGAPSSPDDDRAPPAPPDEPDPESSAAGAMGGASDADGSVPDDEVADAEPAADEAPIERTTVRITRDVGDIFGVDEREYSLYADDVVTLPSENAKPLLDRDAAEKLE